MHLPDKFKGILPQIESKIKVKFQDQVLLFLAFVHRSFVNEEKEVDTHNERLEFLGDSVLGLIVSEYLFEKWPDKPEGELSKTRALLVEAQACVKYMHQLNIESFVFLGKGESQSLGRGRETILANVFEALIGAMYLDQGYEKTKQFFLYRLKESVTEILDSPTRNYKAELQDYAQKNHQLIPDYQVLSETGPDHAKEFVVGVYIEKKLYGEGTGASKKIAEQQAAAAALQRIEKEP